MPRAASCTGIASGELQRARRIQRDLPAGKMCRIDAPQHNIGIRYRRLLAAFAVAGGTGVRPRTVRTDDNAPQCIDACDRTAAGADLRHVDDRDAHREAAALREARGPRDFEMP
jgi:hypothetical protein